MKSTKEKFFEKVAKSEDGHWYWHGSKGKDRHGFLNVYRESGKRTHTTASRVSWEIHKGPIPENALVCHSCDKNNCVNPDHLYLCTRKLKPFNGQA